MRIRALACVPLSIPLPAAVDVAMWSIRTIGCVHVRLETDEGPVGESVLLSVNGKRLGLMLEMVRSLEDLVVGLEVGRAGSFWRRAWEDVTFVGRHGLALFGLSAVDCALWDLRAKCAGLGVAQLLGQVHESLPVYASGGLWLSASIDELQQEAARFVAQGFRAVKMRIGRSEPEDVLRVRSVREAVGPDVELMVDAFQSLTVPKAIRLAQRLEEFDLRWFEDPLPPHDVDGAARVAAATCIPIAGGESDYTRYAFKDLLTRRALQVAMPDLQRVGGVTEFVKVAAMAEAFDVEVASHLFTEMSAQVLSAVGPIAYLEHMPWLEPIFEGRLRIEQGRVCVPSGQGWGIAFDRQAIERLRLDR